MPDILTKYLNSKIAYFKTLNHTCSNLYNYSFLK